VVKGRGAKIMIEKTEKNKKYLDFFENESYKDVFNSDYKRAVFLTGVLTEKLLNIQYKERGSKLSTAGSMA